MARHSVEKPDSPAGVDADSVQQNPVLLVEKAGALLHVTLNRPDSRNPLSRELVDCLSSTFTKYATDMDLKVAIVTGAGNKAFAAGGDLKELMAIKTAVQAKQMSRTTRAAFQTLRDFPVPVIAAINGDALGGGAEFALACDIRIAAPHCRIGLIQGRLGISTAWGGAHDLIKLAGPAAALSLTSRSELIDMQTGCQLGLIDHVAREDESLDDAVRHYCAPIIEKAPHVLRTFKALTREAKNKDRAEPDRLETELFAANWIHGDHWKAVEKIFLKRG